MNMVARLAAGAIALAAFSSAQAQTPATATNCYKDAFGTVCKNSEATKPLTNSDYGAIYVQATPPASITEDIVKANKGGWKSWLARYFIPGANTGQIVLELRRGASDAAPLLATIPVATFSIDTKTGVKVVSQQEFSSLIQATPYFPLDPNTNPIRAVFTVRSTNDPSSNILSTVSEVTRAAALLGGHGWLVSAVADPAIQTSLGGIESRIVANSSSNVKSTTPIGISFETDTSIDYNYGLNPKGTDTSGRVFIQLVRRPSVFTAKVKDGKPDYGLTGRTDTGATQFFLDRKVNDTQSMESYIRDNSAGQYAKFRANTVSAAEFNSACDSVKTVITGDKSLALNGADVEAVIWAAWTSGQNTTRPSIQNSDCMSGELTAFGLFGLTVRPPGAEPIPDQKPDLKPDPKLDPKPKTDAQLSGPRLKSFMEDGVMHELAQSGSDRFRVRHLRELFADTPKPDISVDAGPDLASLTPTSNAQAIAEKLAGFQLKPGCFYRDDDQNVRFLGRVLSPSTGITDTLWMFIIGLTSAGSTATPDNTTISSLVIRPPAAADFTSFKDKLPSRTECHDPKTALN